MDVVWLEPGNQWDQHTFELLLNNKLWGLSQQYGFKHHKDFPKAEGIILVVPQKYYLDKVDWLNARISEYQWVIYIGTGNEEGEFPIDHLPHPNIKIYYTTPHLKNTPMEYIDRSFGDGFAPQSEVIKDFTKEVMTKPLDVYFGGQITHSRRRQCVEAIKLLAEDPTYKTELLETKGFTQGYDDPKEYYKRMASAKVTPCPSGPAIQDTFRTYEALEAMSIPIVDSKTPEDAGPTDYWTILFGKEPPFPIIRDDYESLPNYVRNLEADWPRNINRITAWWIAKKREYAQNLNDDIQNLSDIAPTTKEQITVLIPSSPIKSHPDTLIIDETISTTRTHLPNAEIILMLDGVREEQEDRRADYEQYIYRVLWKCLHEWKNVLPLIFDDHQHQANMTRKALEYVQTPLILFVEHDTPLTPDTEIPFKGIAETVLSGEADIVRLHHEALILDVHKHLMFDTVSQNIHGVPMMRTRQWSSRPHVSSVAYYRRILNDYFSPDSKTFIEDRMYSIVEQACRDDGIQGWYNHRLCIYTPAGDIKRSYHTDGREGEEKFDAKQVF
jgi:hypothetical protein